MAQKNAEEALILIHMNHPIILKMDGGICQQVRIYACARAYMKMGYEVKFDTTWFSDYGMDMYGRFVRNFDLLRAFPELPFVEATREETEAMKQTHFARYRRPEDITAPAYVSVRGIRVQRKYPD